MVGNLTCIFWVLLGTYIGVNSIELFVNSSGEYSFTIAAVYGLFVLGLFQFLDWTFLKVLPSAFELVVAWIKSKKQIK